MIKHDYKSSLIKYKSLCKTGEISIDSLFEIIQEDSILTEDIRNNWKNITYSMPRTKSEKKNLLIDKYVLAFQDYFAFSVDIEDVETLLNSFYNPQRGHFNGMRYFANIALLEAKNKEYIKEITILFNDFIRKQQRTHGNVSKCYINLRNSLM